jgi:glycerol-3-phosphate acyltransferase PlsX
MPKPVRISLDAMGGDHGASVVVPGAALALERRPEIRFLMIGDEAVIAPLLDRHPGLKAATEVRHTDVTVAMDDKPSQAIRSGRGKSSMWKAIQAVRDGEAEAAVSAGNTGALMAMAKICLKTMAHIERPAIACMWPTLRGESIVLDVGATIGADAGHLVDMAIMGAAMARIVLDLDRPTVGLLNVGTEEIKGIETVREAGRILRERDLPFLDYRGFVEGDDLGKGTVDVVVTEGFTGNIALKTAEGTAKQLAQYLRSAMSRTLMAKIGYLLAKQAFEALRDKMDPRKVNGGVFLGLEGVVIKSHGGTDALGFASAIDIASDMAQFDLMKTIRDMLEHQPLDEEPA